MGGGWLGGVVEWGLVGCEAEVKVDLAGGGGLVEGVEVEAGDAVVEEVGALFCGVVDADALDGLGVVSCALEGFEEFGGEAGAGGKVGHTFEAGEAGDGHDACDDWDVDACEMAALAEVVEVAIVEEKLGADVVGALIDFGFEVIHFE